MSYRELQISQYIVGDNYPPFIIAEAGVHHNNSVELAKEYILQARIAGAQAIKFQTYQASRLATRWAPTYWNDNSGKTQFDIFSERSLFKPEDYRKLFHYANDVGILLLSTPFDPDSAKFLDKLGMAAFKIASADITNFPLLSAVAQLGKPILLSTGASTMKEVSNALALLRPFGIPVALLHCSLAYPTSLADANLQRIRSLHNQFPDYVIGYSDHTQPQDSELACPLSIALGARVIEKHFTLNKALSGDDHYHAVDSLGLARLVKNCFDAYLMTATYQEITKAEFPARTYARRSIVAAHPIPKGNIITLDDIDFKRPGTGLSPNLVEQVIGKRTVRDLITDELIKLEDLES